MSEGVIDVMVDYAQDRKQFGQSLSSFQGIQWFISDSSAEAEAAGRLLERAIRRPERFDLAQSAVVRTTDIAVSVSDRAIQVHGGYGFTREYTPERFWRAAHQLRSGVLDNSRETLSTSPIISSVVCVDGFRRTDITREPTSPRSSSAWLG